MIKVPISRACSFFKQLFVLLHKKDPDRYHYLLWLKFIVANLSFSAMFFLAFMQGWVDKLFAKDPKMSWVSAMLSSDMTTAAIQTKYIAVMVVLFFVALVISALKVFETSKEINFLKMVQPPEFSRVAEYLAQIDGADSGSRTFSHQLLRDKWFGKITVIQYISNSLMLLGLVGTVLGFIFALSGVRPDAAGDVSAIGPMVSTLIVGMAFALYTTVGGAFFGGFWLSLNYRIIAKGSVDFLSLLGEHGERVARDKARDQCCRCGAKDGG